MAVLAVRGDLRHLSCHAWYLPGDFRPFVAEYWFKEDPELETAVARGARELPDDWREDGTRVLPLLLPDERRARPVLAAIPNSGTDDWGYHRETLRQFVDVAVTLEPPSHLRERARRLLAVPLIGTGRSAWRASRARHLDGLLTALEQESQRTGADFVVVAHSEADWAALQAVRRRRTLERGVDPELTDLAAPAEALAARARRGQLVVFTGAGTGQPAGLPDWRTLLTELATWAGFDAQTADRLRQLDLLDQAAVISARKGEGHLADWVAQRMQAPHCSLTHSLLANLPVQEYVTLNYDQLLELAAHDACAPLAVLPYEPAGQRWLLKLHGCVAPDRRKDIVLTRSDYLSLREHRATLTGLVQALLVTRHMLFVGFGLADDHFHAVVHDVRRALGPGRQTALGTALLLEHDDLREELWKDDLSYVAMAGGSRADSARRLELFLDHLLLQSATSDAHLFDPSYEQMLTEDERRLRSVLTQAFEGRSFGEAPAWIRVQALLRDLGWRDRR